MAGGQPQTVPSKSSPKISPKLSPKVAAKVPKPVLPASASVATSVTSTDATGGKTSQLSPKTGQSSPKTGQKEEASSSTAASSTTVISIQVAESPKLHLLSVLGVLIPHMKYTQQETRMESLRWLMWLHQQLPKRVREHSSWLVWRASPSSLLAHTRANPSPSHVCKKRGGASSPDS